MPLPYNKTKTEKARRIKGLSGLVTIIFHPFPMKNEG